jgi:hypothetical protein
MESANKRSCQQTHSDCECGLFNIVDVSFSIFKWVSLMDMVMLQRTCSHLRALLDGFNEFKSGSEICLALYPHLSSDRSESLYFDFESEGLHPFIVTNMVDERMRLFFSKYLCSNTLYFHLAYYGFYPLEDADKSEASIPPTLYEIDRVSTWDSSYRYTRTGFWAGMIARYGQEAILPQIPFEQIADVLKDYRVPKEVHVNLVEEIYKRRDVESFREIKGALLDELFQFGHACDHIMNLNGFWNSLPYIERTGFVVKATHHSEGRAKISVKFPIGRNQKQYTYLHVDYSTFLLHKFAWFDDESTLDAQKHGWCMTFMRELFEHDETGSLYKQAAPKI